MPTIDDNIETLSQRMLNDANAEAEHILAEARAKADEIRKRALVQAETERKAILERARQDVERVRSQEIASAQLKVRNDQLEFRERLLEDIFKAARQKIPTVRQWSNYDEIATVLLKEALAHLKDYPVQVRLDPAIEKLIPSAKLEQITKELSVQVSAFQPLEHGTGVVVEATDGHLNYDNTLETRLARLQNILRAPVYHMLMGEQV